MSAPRGVFAGLVSFLVFASTLAATVPVSHAAGLVSWPASTGIVLAEVMTGGASASDEYVEIANAASTPQDLGGLELVYVTASGSTVTRKANFTSSLWLAPGQHLLIANAAGIFGPLADLTYSGGIASDGGVLAIRHVGGAVVDSVGWGSAANSFVEGSPAPAPAVRCSIERRPGGADGNRLDTNDNLADWFVQSNPVPQSLASTPTPGASPAPPSASLSESTAPTQESTSASEPAATATPIAPTATVTPASSTTPAAPTATMTPTPSETPTSGASAPSATVAPPTLTPATPGPTPAPTASPSPSPSSAVTPIAEARTRADGTAVTIEGVLTTRLAALESGRGGFVQDASGGIALYLPEIPAPALPAGTRVRVGGTLDDRYGQRTIRVDEGGLSPLGEDALPEPVRLSTGDAGEGAEGIVVAISGTVTATPDSLTDGLGIWLDDGSGPLRVVAAPSAVGDLTVTKGMSLAVTGPLGQRASGSSPGYRVEDTEPGSIEVLAQPSPTPTAQSSSGAFQTASPSPSSGDPETDLESISRARTRPAGATVHLAGVITALAGIAVTPGLIAMGDSSGGIFVRLAGQVDGIQTGRSIELVGVLSAPYGQLEVRELQWLVLGSDDTAPAPVPVHLADIGEQTEGSLVTIKGTVDSIRTDSGRLTLAVGDGSVEVRVLADPSTGLTRADVARGDVVALTGIVGQRASASGAADGYRLWLRSASDLVVVPQIAPTTDDPAPDSSQTAIRHDLASALGEKGGLVDVDATVTAQAGLFDIGGPTIAVDDGTAAVAVVLPTSAEAPRVGSRIQIIGRVGRWEGGPTVVASKMVIRGDLQATQPRQVAGSLGPDVEWRLVRVCGRIDRLTRAGSRWRLELNVSGRQVIVLGEPGARISTANLTAGRLAVVTGVVRRSTSDSSVFQLLPRSPLDVRVGAAPEALAALAAGSGGLSAMGSASSHAPGPAAPHVEIAALAGHLGERVTITGLVADSDGERATIDDGTGEVRVGGADAAGTIALLEPGDAIEVAGTVTRDEAGLLLAADPMSMVTLPGDQSGQLPVTEPAAGLRTAGSPDSSATALGAGAAASIRGDSGGMATPGVVGVVLLALLAMIAAVLAVVRVSGKRRGRSWAESFTARLSAARLSAARLSAAANREWRLPRPKAPSVRLRMPAGRHIGPGLPGRTSLPVRSIRSLRGVLRHR